MLILTLTISAFDPEDDSNLTAVAGDYSAVFPLLVISVFVSLMLSRQSVFYDTQRSRGDIMALPEVLCEPGKEGTPMVLDYDKEYYDEEGSEYSSEGYMTDQDTTPPQQEQQITQDDIEKEFNAKAGEMTAVLAPQEPPASRRTNSSESAGRGISPLPPRPHDKKKSSEELLGEKGNQESAPLGEMSSSRLDELLSKPLDYERPAKARHRRIQSAPDVNFGKRFRNRSGTFDKNMAVEGNVSESAGGGGRHTRSDSFNSQASGKVMRVATVGHLSVEQPSLMDQARLRAATRYACVFLLFSLFSRTGSSSHHHSCAFCCCQSVIVESRHVRHPSMPSRIPRGRHSRQSSASSIGMSSGGTPPLSVAVAANAAGLPTNEVESAYTSAVNRETIRSSVHGNNRTENGSARPQYYN